MAQRTGHAVTHTLRLSSHAFLCRQNFDRSGAVVCAGQDACSHLRDGTGAEKDHKGNTSLTELWLDGNKVGGAGAAALAKALQAMVMTCRKCVCSGRVFAVTANVASQSHVKSWRRQLVGQCALRLL